MISTEMAVLRSSLFNLTVKDSARVLLVSSLSAALNLRFSSFIFSDGWMLRMFEGDRWIRDQMNGWWFDDGQKIKKMYELWPPHQNFGFYFVFSLLCVFFSRYRPLPNESPSTAVSALRLLAVSGFLFTALLLPMRIGEFHVFVLGLNLVHVALAPQVVLCVAKSTEFVEQIVFARSAVKTKEE